MYQIVTEGNSCFSRKKQFSKSSKFYYLELGLYPSITNIVQAMNTLIQECCNHSENFITEMSRRTQKVEICFANERSDLEFFSTNLGHIFGSNVGNDFEVMLRGNRTQKIILSDAFVRINHLIIYRDLIEYNIIGDNKAPLLSFYLDSTWTIRHLATCN